MNNINDNSRVLIAIPARLESTRLPNKPLADINGIPMIVRVWQQAIAADIGDVIVAAANKEIIEVIEKYGGKAILTEPDLPSGSDRIAEAVNNIGAEYDIIVNLQGDLPLIEPAAIRECIEPLQYQDVDIATLAAIITDENEKNNPNVVKAVLDFSNVSQFNSGIAIASDFVRELPENIMGDQYHHIGIYAYRKSCLDDFVSLPRSKREEEAKLEQLRALDAGMSIGVKIIDVVPLGVDTKYDLEKVRELVAGRG